MRRTWIGPGLVDPGPLANMVVTQVEAVR